MTAERPPARAARSLVLSYHRIAPAAPDPWGLRVGEACFAAQMATLRSIAEPVTLAELAARRRGAGGRLAVAGTFDDGYTDNLAALPYLTAYSVPATVFVATGYTGRRHFWWEVLAACRTRDFRSITTAVRLRRRGHQTAGGAPITS